MDHSIRQITRQVRKQVSINLRRLKSYQTSFSTTTNNSIKQEINYKKKIEYTIYPKRTQYCKSTYIFSNQGLHFVQINTQKWYCWIVLWFYFQFFEESSCYFSQQLYYFILPSPVHDSFLFSTSSPTLVIVFVILTTQCVCVRQ